MPLLFDGISSYFNKTAGLTTKYLTSRLIGFGADGANVMMDSQNGAAALILSNYTVLHISLNYLFLMQQRQLLSWIHLKEFSKSVYSFYHRSPKRLRHFEGVADILN